jgi:cytosine/adenosine deaminase-related metal-dependent hydrolase
MSLYLRNATYINPETLEFKKCNIKVEEGIDKKIQFIGIDEIPESDKIINCEGKYVTKSFACGHHHIYSALACGMPAPAKNPENFTEILKYIWWNIDKQLDKQMIEASALTTAIELAKQGSTFVIDHHASPNFIEGSLEIIAKAFDRVGVSHLLCYEISDRDGLDKAEKGIFESENYIKNNQGLIGAHASFTIGNKTLEKIAEVVAKNNSGIHIHVAEDIADQELCIKEYNKRVIERLNDYGFLDFSKTIIGHAIHINENERKILKNSKAWIVQNSESNQNNKVGSFSPLGLNENLMFGTDGMHSNMLRSTKAAFYAAEKNDGVGFDTIYNRFRNVHKYIKYNNFKGDGDNNLVILDYNPRTEFNSVNFLGHFVFGIESNHIEHVISNGKLIVENREVQTIDENEVHEFSREQSRRLWGNL